MDTTPKTPDSAPLPPDAALIRLARIGAGITIADAANASKTATSRGVSVPRWNQVEANRETRDGQTRPVHPKPQTVAMMAYGVNKAARSAVISPERMQAEGRNPEAAAYLAEMLAQEPVTPPARIVQFPSAVEDPGQRSAVAPPAAIPYIARIRGKLTALASKGIPREQATGADLFGEGSQDAATWDELRSEFQLNVKDATEAFGTVVAREAEEGRQPGHGFG